MPQIIPPTYDELLEIGRQELEPLGFNYWGEGSGIGAILKIQALYASQLWQGVAAAGSQLDLASAQGVYLDRIGEGLGVTRLPAQVATTLGLGAALKFTNTGGIEVTLPAGTRIWNSVEPSVAFFTDAALVLSAGAEGYVHVTAGQSGERHNLGANVLDAHNGPSQVTVTNVRPLGGGALTESDASYRYRISQAWQARSGGTETAIRQALLRVPGVRDILLYPGIRGAGSLDVLVVPVDRFASQELLTACEQATAEVVAAGISWRVRAPVPRRVNVNVKLRLTPGASFAEISVLVETQVRAYLDNLRTNDGAGGSSLIWNELISRVQDAHADIIDSEITLNVDGVPLLQTNFTPNPGDRLVSHSVSVT